MKILLLQPPARDFYDTELRLLPLGLCYLKAALLRRVPGVEVIVRDYRQGHGRRTVELSPELSDLREFYPHPDKSPFGTFHGFYHFGAGFEGIAREVQREKPDLVGISCLFSAYYKDTLALAKEIKTRLGVPVVTGGAHGSSAPDSLLESGVVDYVIRGEGERPLVELVKALQGTGELSKVPNLAFRNGGKIQQNPVEPNYPLEGLPQPDFSDFEPGRYRMGKLPLAPLLASRGCPVKCGFCSVSSVFGSGYRTRPVGDIVGEMKSRWEAGYRVFDFEDDNLTLDRKFFAGLCREIIAGFPEETPVLQAMNGVSYHGLDDELLQLMKRAGFTHLNLALVSLDEGVSRLAGRPFDAEKFRATVLTGFLLGYRIVAYQILGLPGETLASMTETFAFLTRLPVLMGASPFYLAPGSPMAKEFDFTEADFVRCRLTAMGRNTANFGREDIFTLFVTTRIVNFLKGLPLEGREVCIEEALEIAEGLGGRSAIGARLLSRLLADGILCAETPAGEKPIPPFKAGLFREILQKTGKIGTQDGGGVRL